MKRAKNQDKKKIVSCINCWYVVYDKTREGDAPCYNICAGATFSEQIPKIHSEEALQLEKQGWKIEEGHYFPYWKWWREQNYLPEELFEI